MMMNRTNKALLMAVAVAALMAGSDFAAAQRMDGTTGGMQGGAMQGGGAREGGAREGAGSTTGRSVQRGEPGPSMRERSGAEQRGSNERRAQGPERRNLAPGERGPNARGAQGVERGRGTTGRGPDRNLERSPSNERATRSERSGTTGQSERSSTRGQSERFTTTGRSERSTTTTGQSDRTRTETTGSVNLNSEQRTRIRETVLARRDIPRVSSVDFDVRVNAVVPRRIRLVAVPDEIVRIFPRFRRNRVVIIGDEVVIVDPVTFRIVAVLPA